MPRQVYIRDHLVDDMYTVGALDGAVTVTTAQALLCEEDWVVPTQPGDRVLAQHPAHEDSYAPAVVKTIEEQQCVVAWRPG